MSTIRVSLFSGKKSLITSGTGSFGNPFLNRITDLVFGKIRNLSRDLKTR
jgi:FlaA1/EpsC-like NDP-sugar epimerase